VSREQYLRNRHRPLSLLETSVEPRPEQTPSSCWAEALIHALVQDPTLRDNLSLVRQYRPRQSSAIFNDIQEA
jgi:hypothetical protein